MKNISLAVVLILSLVFSSCNIAGNSTGPNPEEDSSRSGSTGITDVASVTESQSESIIPVVPEFRFNKEDTRIFWRERASAIQYSDLEDSMDSSYSRIIWGTDPAAITLPVLSILPEESGSSKSSGNDSRNDNIYHVGSLGLDLKIPDGYYLYRVNGRYKDPDGNPVELEFVDEYIFTVKDVKEEQLISDMILYDTKNHRYNYPYYKNPGYILYSFKVFPKEYLPIESLYVSNLQMTQEYRFCGEYCVAPGVCEWRDFSVCFHDPEAIDPEFEEHGLPEIPRDENPVFDWESALYEKTAGAGLRYHDTKPMAAEDLLSRLFLFDESSLFKNSTAGRLLRARGFTTGGERVLSADTSVVNDLWWHNYTAALEMFNKGLDSRYPECRILFDSMLSSWNLTGDIKAYEEDLLSGWYTDEASDHELRAFIYANLSVRMDIRPEDVMIFLKDTEHGRLFYAFLIDRDSEEAKTSEAGMILTPVDRGVDDLAVCGLEFARTYVEKYLR